jgi:hypothetical protein
MPGSEWIAIREILFHKPLLPRTVTRYYTILGHSHRYTGKGG